MPEIISPFSVFVIVSVCCFAIHRAMNASDAGKCRECSDRMRKLQELNSLKKKI